MGEESGDIKECIVIKDDIVDIIIVKNTDCSMQEAINRAIEKLHEV